MSDIIIITLVDEDYVDSWFSVLKSSKEKASQTIAVRSKTDKSISTNKTLVLDVHAKRYQLENAVRVKQERKARTQSPKRDKIKRNRCKKSHRVSRLRQYKFVIKKYYLTLCMLQRFQKRKCAYPCLMCTECHYSLQ